MNDYDILVVNKVEHWVELDLFEKVSLKGLLEHEYSVTRILLSFNLTGKFRGSSFRWLKGNLL